MALKEYYINIRSGFTSQTVILGIEINDNTYINTIYSINNAIIKFTGLDMIVVYLGEES